MLEENFKILLGSRILNEANDLKRTTEALAQEIGVDIEWLKKVIQGRGSIAEAHMVIEKMAARYPIDRNTLLLTKDDCDNGVKIMRAKASEASARIFDRKDKSGELTPYYEYRDTAMAKIAPFRPEWIRELRVVEDQNPQNPDVSYNNGHALHQMTFFIGSVNFYWEVAGKKFSREMRTGDSNYITPYWPHSFTARDASKKALILAVTFGGDVRRASNELYVLGERGINGYAVDYRDHNKAVGQLVKQHRENEYMTPSLLKEKITRLFPDIELDQLLEGKRKASEKELEAIAHVFNIETADLTISRYKPADEVVVKHKSAEDSYFYPNESERLYKIYPLARTTKMPLAKGFDIEVLQNTKRSAFPLRNSLHGWIYNYGVAPARFSWTINGKEFDDILEPGDSVYVQPFVSYAFSNSGIGNATLCSMGVGGSVNLTVERELSYFSHRDRIIEKERWFD